MVETFCTPDNFDICEEAILNLIKKMISHGCSKCWIHCRWIYYKLSSIIVVV